MNSQPGYPMTTSSTAELVEPPRTNILIVDDLPEKHLVFASILEELGQQLVMVRSGREALRCVLESEFAVILLDVNMPDIDGFETASLIRRYKKTLHTPILFITAYVDDIQAVRGYALGAVDYISSPVVPEILRSKVKVFVELHQKNQQLRAHAEEREALVRAETARAAAEAATRRADFIARAGQRLTQSLDVAKTAIELLDLTVPQLAQRALLVLVDEVGRPIDSRVAVSSGDGALIVDARPAWSSMPTALSKAIGDDPFSLGEQAVDAAVLDRYIAQAIHECHGSAVDALGQSSAAHRFAFTAGAAIRGVLMLAQGVDGDRENGDIALIRELIGRAAIAFDNASLYQAIQDEDRRKTEFLAMLAHELRNPLAPIANAAHVMRSMSNVDAKIGWASNLISRQVSHMARMVDDLLDASRIKQGKIFVERAVITLDAIIDRADEAIQPFLSGRGQRLVIEPLPAGVNVVGDLIRLAQVLSNLLHNASKFSPDGADITLRARFEHGRLTIAVIDRGIGIDASFKPRLFELFAQGDQALDRSIGGLGIGLTLVKHLVELHGGRVDVLSAGIDQGSTFTIELPASQSVASDSALAGNPPSAARSPIAARILVVEDMEESAISLRMVLTLEGHRVELAADGVAALARFESFQPAIVLLDVGLPGMNGFEVARRIRSIATNDPLIVALTGYGQLNDLNQRLDDCFDQHIVKPADLPKLFKLIDDHMLGLTAPISTVSAR